MPFPKIKLAIGVTVTPASQAKTIWDYFDRAYKGERGTDETKEEFYYRKLEEFTAGICDRMYRQDETVGLDRQLQKEVSNNFEIRQQKNKPVEENELGENDPSMMPEPAMETEPKKLSPAKARSKRRR